MKEQFASWGMYDNSAVCLDCGHQHLIPKSEQISEQPWLDWLAKHPGHETFILPHRLLSRLSQPLRENADVKAAYIASAAYNITLASLASDTNLLAGRESDGINSSTNKALDELVAGKITVGTTPTTAKQIEVHAVGTLNDTPTYPDVFDGTESAETISNAQIKNAICASIVIIEIVATTSDLAYPFKPTGIRQLFGDALPSAHVLFVTHNSVAALNATGGNHVINHTPVYATVI